MRDMAEPVIDRAALEHLARLARIELDPDEEATLLHDLVKILDYIGELKTLDTSSVEPMSGGTRERNTFRDDGEREGTDRGEGTDAFPEVKDGFLKIPPVFSAEGGSLPGRQAGASGGE
jgi:aspartyl-tRNA(Asn)/glutamyl-tRNA(Gln) amidotransferase subunit C